MLRDGDWITPHLNRVPYFDKPPLLYWVTAGSFGAWGLNEWAARLWSVIPAVAVAVLTAWIGTLLASARAGFLAGLMVAANLEMFLFGRMMKPDLLVVALMLLALGGFILAYLGAGRRGLLLFYASLALAALAKDILGALGPLMVVAVFLWLTREGKTWQQWVPWSGLTVFVAILVPWHAAMEWKHRGFLWYMIVDNHLLNVTRQRVFPDEDVPLTAVEFLAVTAIGFFPWVLALPWAVRRAFRRPWDSPEKRMWLLLGLWTIGVVGVFTLSPFKLPHYGLPAFPAMALLVARLWDDVLDRETEALSAQKLLAPAFVALCALTLVFFLFWRGILELPAEAIAAADVSARNMAAKGEEVSTAFLRQVDRVFATIALIFGLGAVGVAVGLWRRQALIGLGTLIATMLAFLPVTVEGLTMFAKSRSVRLVADAVAARATPADILAHEGPIENSASWLLSVDPPVKIVNGLQSNLAFGATFPSARGTFWDSAALAQAWRGPRRVFMISVVRPERSVVRELAPTQVHVLAQGGGRWLYSNRP